MSYDIRIVRSADRSLARMPRTVQGRPDAAVGRLAEDSHPQGSERLSGSDPIYRIRVGDYRLLYTTDEVERTVTVVRIGHRRDVYRGI